MNHKWQSNSSLNVEFDFEIEDEDKRLLDIVAFAETHRLFYSQTTSPYWSEYDHEIHRVNINFYRRVGDNKIESPAEVIEDAQKLLELLQLASANATQRIDAQFRFRVSDITELNEVIEQVSRRLDLPSLPLIYRGSGYGETDFQPFYMYELDLDNETKMLAKLKFEDLANLFNGDEDAV